MSKHVRPVIIFFMAFIVLLSTIIFPYVPTTYAANFVRAEMNNIKSLPNATIMKDLLLPPKFDAPEIIDMDSVINDVYGKDIKASSSLERKKLGIQVAEERKSAAELEDAQWTDRFIPKLVFTTEKLDALYDIEATRHDIYELNELALENSNIDALKLLKEKRESKLSWNQWLAKEFGNSISPTVSEGVYETKTPQGDKESPIILQPNANWPITVQGDTYSHNSSIQSAASPSDIMIDDEQQARADRNKNLIAQQQINQLKQEQYADRKDVSELIDPATGSITLKYNLLNYKGLDDLDMNLGIMYQSNQASVVGSVVGPFYAWRTPDGGCPPQPIPGYECPQRIKYDEAGMILWDSPNYFLERYKLGMGWSYQLPSVQRQGAYDYYHDGQGAVYQIKMDAVSGPEATTHLINYPGRNVKFIMDSSGSFNNGQYSSVMYMEHANKKREYFDIQGRLLGIVDRYGHKIVYEYDSNDGRFTQITDTTGRKIKFRYGGTLGTDPQTSITISITDRNGQQHNKIELQQQKTTFTHKKKERFVGSTLRGISLIEDTAEGRKYLENTGFDYQGLAPKFNYEAKNYAEFMGINYYQMIKTVDYPKTKSHYAYNQILTKNLGTAGMSEIYVLTNRSDEIKQEDGQTGRLINQMSYSYDKNATGYPDYMDPDQVPAGYTYSSTSKVVSNTPSNGLETTTVFNASGQRLSTESKLNEQNKKITQVQSYHPEFKFLPVLTSSTVTDSAGSKTLYMENQYDETGNVIASTMPLSQEQLNNAAFKKNHSIEFAYESNFNLLQLQRSYQRNDVPLEQKLTYTSSGRLASSTDSAGQTTTYRYAFASGSPETISEVVEEKTLTGGMKTHKVTSYGSETAYVLPGKASETFKASANGSQNTLTVSYIYDPASDQVVKETDSQGKVKVYSYDSLDRIMSIKSPSVTNQDGEKYDIEDGYEYTNGYVALQEGAPRIAVQIVSSWRSYKKSSNSSEVVMDQNVQMFNGYGDLVTNYIVERRQERATPLVQMTRYINDDQNRVIEQQRAVYEYSSNGASLNSVNAPVTDITAEYDGWGKTVSTKDALGNATRTDSFESQNKTELYVISKEGSRIAALDQQHDQWGNLLNATAYLNPRSKTEPVKETYTYDIAGNMLTYTDPNQNKENQSHNNYEPVTQRMSFNSLNQLTNMTDALNQIASYRYDGNGELMYAGIRKNGDAAETVIYQKKFNERSDLLTKTDAANESLQFTYDTMGRMSTNTDRNRSLTQYKYDEAGRVLNYEKSMTFPKKQDINYIYTFGKGSAQTDQASIQITGLPKVTQQTTVDSVRRPTRHHVYTSSNDYVGTYNIRYNTWGQVENIKTNYQAGFSVAGTQQNYSYDAKQQLSNVVLNGTAKSIRYTYTPQGKVESITYPPMTNGKILKSYYEYDSLGRLLKLTNTLDASELSISAYTYDDNGNIIQAMERRNGKEDRIIDYKYDKLNRLTTVNEKGKGEALYSYDLRGNRITLDDSRLSESDILSRMKNTSYTYNVLNKLENVRQDKLSVSFQYQSDGTRYQKQVSKNDNSGELITENYKYISNNNGKVIFEAKDEEYTEYIRGEGNRVMLKKKPGSNTLHYYIYNGHGDVVGILYDNGTIANTYEYDEFGNITAEQQKIYNPFKYSGEYQDQETGLYLLQTRYYDPTIGRFLNEDIYEGQVNNPLSFNAYTYVQNNPLIYTDPNGTDVWLIHGTQLLGKGNGSATWTKGFVKYLSEVFRGETIHYNFEWDGGNSTDSRRKAADALTSQIYNYYRNEKIRLVGHSHGGNVAIGVANNLSQRGVYVTTLITIATPVRSDYQLSTGVIQHIHVYNSWDGVQWNGGMAAHIGAASRKFRNNTTTNIEVAIPEEHQNPGYGTYNHSAMHSDIDTWEKYIEPELIK